MTTNPSLRNATFPDARHGLDITEVLFGIVIVFLAQGIGRVVQRAQQSLLPPGPGTHTLIGSTLTLPALQVAVCTLFLFPWALLCDRCGPRLPYTGGLLVWALGVFTGSWSGSVEQAIDVALLGRYFERFADHAVAVARRVIYIITGQFPEGEEWPNA